MTYTTKIIQAEPVIEVTFTLTTNEQTALRELFGSLTLKGVMNVMRTESARREWWPNYLATAMWKAFGGI